MIDWISLLSKGDPVLIIIVIVLILITGGAGQSVVSGIMANRRGVKGDALVKEQNGINGLGMLTERQDSYIETLETRINKMEENFNSKVEELEKRLEAEIDYSNSLINTLSENTIPIPPRPKK